MEFVKTFEGFLNESELNEGKNHGDMSDAIGGGDDDAFGEFFKAAKVGDTFEYAPDGVELDFIDKAELNKPAVELQFSEMPRGGKGVLCKVVKKAKVTLSGGGMEFDGDKEEAIYFTMEGDNNKVYVLTNAFG